MSVFGVQHVSGFAQTNTDDGHPRALVSRSVVRSYVPARGVISVPRECAANVLVAPAHQAAVDGMLARSPTFRRQCARLAGTPNVTVILRSNPPAGTRVAAVTQVSRRPAGRLEAVVLIGPSQRATELIAHELEHVIEQLDGVDLEVKSRLRDSGVRRVGEANAFETTRAVVTGLRVAQEVLDRVP